jgi:hypothetical protein
MDPIATFANEKFIQTDESTASISLSQAVSFLRPTVPAPFPAIRHLFDYLSTHPSDAVLLNSIYPSRGILKTAAANNPYSDQKFTIDLSPRRAARIPPSLAARLNTHSGLDSILHFFGHTVETYVQPILDMLGKIAGAELAPLHSAQNFNFRLCDYTPATAAPESSNGCGAHTDYGTFSIIFQDGQAGLEVEKLDEPGVWVTIPGDATIVLCGWCALILSGDRIQAARHRVRRAPGIRRLSAVLFVAPNLDVVLRPLKGDSNRRSFSEKVMGGRMSVRWFKEVMGKRWRWREGNEDLEGGDDITQDEDVEKLVWESPKRLS